MSRVEPTSASRCDQHGRTPDDLHVHEVISRELQLAKRLQTKEEAVRAARRRLAAQRQALREQSRAAQRAAREPLVERVRLREAESAIANASSSDSPTTADAAAAAAAAAAALRDRDAARETAAQLTLRVEELGAALRASGQAQLLDALLRRLASDLEDLKERHQALRTAAATALQPASRRTPHRQRHEERFLHVAAAVSAGSSDERVHSTPRRGVNAVKVLNELRRETDERHSSLHQLYSDVEANLEVLCK